MTLDTDHARAMTHWRERADLAEAALRDIIRHEDQVHAQGFPVEAADAEWMADRARAALGQIEES